MAQQRSRFWYLLDWSNRDKCLIVVTYFCFLQLAYWALVDYVGYFTQFGNIYITATGLHAIQWVFLAGELLWIFLSLWGFWLRARDTHSVIYTQVSLYTFGLPLLAIGHFIGLYNPIVGIMLLGSALTGIMLFDFRRIIGPFCVMVVLLLLLTYVTIDPNGWVHSQSIEAAISGSSFVDRYLVYAPLLQMVPVSKYNISTTWLFLMVLAAIPYVIATFLVTYILLSRWHEREAIIRELSNTDPLTQLLNRRSFFAQSAHALSRLERAQQPAAVAMMDIDHFKKFNDQWGHAVGDAVLEHISQLLSNTLRQGDLLGRYGGEEFVIFLPNARPDDSYRVIERCRQEIEACQVPLGDGKTLSVTASFGLCSLETVNRDDSMTSLVEAADAALYVAKENGRNQVRTTNHTDND